MLAQKLAEVWGQSVVVENRTGAGGSVGADIVAKSSRRRLHAAVRLGRHRHQPADLQEHALRHPEGSRPDHQRGERADARRGARRLAGAEA
jgi:hypothetical protein